MNKIIGAKAFLRPGEIDDQTTYYNENLTCKHVTESMWKKYYNLDFNG